MPFLATNSARPGRLRYEKRMEIAIARLWDGSLAKPEEQVELALIAHPEHLEIRVDAPYHADPAPGGVPGPCPKLWEYEVVEVFVSGRAERYTEIELGPHGHHLVLQLDGVRHAVAEELPIEFSATIEGNRWRGQAKVPKHYFPPPPYRVNAYSIHGREPDRRYLAWTAVPGAQADFHRLEYFRPIQLWSS